MATRDPFSDRHALDDNPFADPTISSALQSSTSLDEEAPTPTQATAPAGGFEAQAAERMAGIRQREEDLERRERELQARAEHIQKHGRNNWPPFYPLIYHDIPAEIPQEHRSIVLLIYRLWLLLVLVLILNFVSCILLLVQGASDGGKDMGASIGYLVFIPIASFLGWYRPVYNGYMKEHSLFYLMFLFFCGWHLLYSIYCAIGIPSTGSAGLINTISMLSQGKLVAGILGVVTTVGWIIQGLGLAWAYWQVYNHYNRQGHTVAQAKGELTSHGFKAYFSRGSQV